MAKYENMMVTTANLDEEASNALINKFKNLIAANGTIDSVDDWGKKRLAYPINDETARCLPRPAVKAVFISRASFLIVSRKQKVDFEAFFKPDRESKHLLLLSYRCRIIDFSKATDT